MAQRNPSAEATPWPGLIALGTAAVLTGAAGASVAHGQIGTWQMTRAAGLVAFALLWLSVVLGLLQSTGYFRAPAVIDYHGALSVWALYATTFHIVVLLFDRHTPYSLAGILVPFASRHQPVLAGIGGLAFYISLGVTVSTYLRGKMGLKAWRTIHLTSLIGFAFALAHSLLLGSDSQLPAVAYMYRFALISVAALLGYRTYLGVKKRADTAGGR